LGDEPYFIQSHVVEVPLGLEARTLEEFSRCLREVDASSIYFHTLEAKIRRGRRQGDFAAWLDKELGLTALAEEVTRVNPYLGGLERMRAGLLRLIDAALAREANDRAR
jgi:hypothetical protein